jgi:hypothetical protein
MFIGHYAIALAAKKAVPKVSLGTLFLSAQLVDLLWPIFLLIGIEHVRIQPGNTLFTPLDFYDYPITHSLVGAIAWSLVFGIFYYFIRKNVRTSIILGLVVFSHWILDFIVHRPDLPLGFGNGVYFGLGLWNSIPGTIILELLLFFIGITIYIRTTSATDRIGTYGFWSFILVILLIYFMNAFGPPPSDASSIAILGNAAWLFIIWPYWINRHRIVTSSETL